MDENVSLISMIVMLMNYSVISTYLWQWKILPTKHFNWARSITWKTKLPWYKRKRRNWRLSFNHNKMLTRQRIGFKLKPAAKDDNCSSNSSPRNSRWHPSSNKFNRSPSNSRVATWRARAALLVFLVAIKRWQKHSRLISIPLSVKVAKLQIIAIS